MRWGTVCLTAVLIISSSAELMPGNLTIDHVTPDEIITPDVIVHTSSITSVNTVSTNNEVGDNLTEQPEDTSNASDTSEEKTDSVETRPSEETDESVPPQVPPNDSGDPDDTGNISSTTSESDSRAGSESEEGSLAESAAESTGESIDQNSEPKSSPVPEDLIVETKSGSVQGYIWQDKENIISYIDIPYGSIENHFQAAKATTWTTLHDVKEHDKRCPQLESDNYVGDTDCLTLSIFKPLTAENASVLFHIHADNFYTGSGDPSIYGPDYLAANGIILVLPNYRLGPLGFLCMQNETAPGNMALKDLSLALSWIHNNIQAFGGNPGNIAVSGEGRSGALAGLLALSPMSKDYICKVITESGSFLSYWAMDRNPTATAAELLNKLSQGDGLSRADISLTDVPLKDLLTAAEGLEFRPCLEIDEDKAFMTVTPYERLKTQTFENTAFLLGSAMFAGVHEALLHTEETIKELNKDFSMVLPDDLRFSTATIKTQIGEQVKSQYFGDETISLDDKKHLSLCFTDMGYLVPGIRSARLLVDAGATVYFYEFSYVGELNRVLKSINNPVEGAVRGDIIGYLFTQDGVLPGEELSEENKMVESLTKMWSNFLKSGSPSIENIEWNSMTKEMGDEEEEWLLISAEPSMKKGIHMERLPLWTEIYQNHFIEENDGHELSPSVYTMLVFQLIFWLGFCRNAPHIVY